MEIKVSEEIKKACPQFAGIAIRATVENTAYSESLWKKIDEFTIRYREMYTTDSIKDMVTIHATREAYKKCGKDPSRYRPSGEALCRRILRGISLYQIDTLVDLTWYLFVTDIPSVALMRIKYKEIHWCWVSVNPESLMKG